MNKVVNLKLLKDCTSTAVSVSIFRSEELFYTHCLGSCPAALTLIGIMEMYSEGNKTRVLIEV